jgi:NTP pyrophosphatase (non-canonical NTP hydrolase)
MDIGEIYKLALDKYGVESQLNQLQEECAELIVSVNKHRRTPFDDLKGITDECADVLIMIDQIANIFDIEDDIEDRIQFKLNRLKERLKNV